MQHCGNSDEWKIGLEKLKRRRRRPRPKIALAYWRIALNSDDDSESFPINPVMGTLQEYAGWYRYIAPVSFSSTVLVPTR